MSNIGKAFENKKAFIAFITCGDPDLETTVKAVKAAADNGAAGGNNDDVVDADYVVIDEKSLAQIEEVLK